MYNLCSKTRMRPIGLCFLWSYTVTHRWNNIFTLTIVLQLLICNASSFWGWRPFITSQPNKMKSAAKQAQLLENRYQGPNPKNKYSELWFPIIPCVQVLGYHPVCKAESSFRIFRTKGSMFQIQALAFSIKIFLLK